MPFISKEEKARFERDAMYSKSKIERLEDELAELKDKKHNPSAACKGCTKLVKEDLKVVRTYMGNGVCVEETAYQYYCRLDNECPDRFPVNE